MYHTLESCEVCSRLSTLPITGHSKVDPYSNNYGFLIIGWHGPTEAFWRAFSSSWPHVKSDNAVNGSGVQGLITVGSPCFAPFFALCPVPW